ncbi:MAG: damage-inducible mutagenesis protein [Acidisphaera sp.]|nr:damage-inducible mutagenesis protein [Acidisphaera sp.]
MTAPASPAEILHALRCRLQQRRLPAAGVLAFGDPRVDAHLPGGGLAVGQLHEVGAAAMEAQTGAAAGGFAAALLARLPGTILWIAPCCDLHPPGLLAYGLDPGRLVLVRTQGDEQTLQVMEAALREGGAGAVLAEAGRLGRMPARRLQHACLGGGVTGFVLRRWPHGRKPMPAEGNAAATRWRLAPAPSDADPLDPHLDPGPPRWRVELLHARGGRPGAWIMEAGNAGQRGPEGQAHPLRVVAALADDPAAPAGPRLRAAG